MSAPHTAIHPRDDVALVPMACATPLCEHGAVVRIDGKPRCTVCAPKHSVFANSLGYPTQWRKLLRAQPEADRLRRDAGIQVTPLPWKRRLHRALSGSWSWGARVDNDPPRLHVQWFFTPKQVAVGVEGKRFNRWGQSSRWGKYYTTEADVLVPGWLVRVKFARRMPSWGSGA